MWSLTPTLLLLPFSALASAVACPFGQAAKDGLLNKDDLANFKAVKRDGVDSEAFSRLHKKDVPLDERGLLPGLSLSLGGGLCKYFSRLLFDQPSH